MDKITEFREKNNNDLINIFLSLLIVFIITGIFFFHESLFSKSFLFNIILSVIASALSALIINVILFFWQCSYRQKSIEQKMDEAKNALNKRINMEESITIANKFLELEDDVDAILARGASVELIVVGYGNSFIIQSYSIENVKNYVKSVSKQFPDMAEKIVIQYYQLLISVCCDAMNGRFDRCIEQLLTLSSLLNRGTLTESALFLVHNALNYVNNEKSLNEKTDLYIELVSQTIRIASNMGYYAYVEDTIRVALKLLRKICSPQDSNYLAILIKYSDLCVNMGNYSDAIKTLKETIKIYQGNRNIDQVINLQMKLSYAYFKIKNINKSNELAYNAINTYKAKYGDKYNDALYLRYNIYYAMSIKEAFEAKKINLDNIKRCVFLGHVKTEEGVSCLHNLAVSYTRLGELQKAKILLKKSVEIGEIIFHENNPFFLWVKTTYAFALYQSQIMKMYTPTYRWDEISGIDETDEMNELDKLHLRHKKLQGLSVDRFAIETIPIFSKDGTEIIAQAIINKDEDAQEIKGAETILRDVLEKQANSIGLFNPNTQYTLKIYWSVLQHIFNEHSMAMAYILPSREIIACWGMEDRRR